MQCGAISAGRKAQDINVPKMLSWFRSVRPIRSVATLRRFPLNCISLRHTVAALGLSQTVIIRMTSRPRQKSSANTSSKGDIIVLQEVGGTDQRDGDLHFVDARFSSLFLTYLPFFRLQPQPSHVRLRLSHIHNMATLSTWLWLLSRSSYQRFEKVTEM